jgi:polyribonucleotide nucleotidyltransferase
MKKVEKSIKLGEKELTLSTGNLAAQASGTILATCGETVVLATVVASNLEKDLGYFPLSVEYQERLYAGGRIKGSRWVKREGRPSDDEILTARLIDRSVRPLFPKEYKGKDVQIVITVLSVDLENRPAAIAPIAASAAISISNIPWGGPIGIVNVGMKNGEYVTIPTESELKDSNLDLFVSSTKDSIVMIEAGSNQLSEEKILKGIAHGKKDSEKVIKLIQDLTEEVGIKKETIEKKKKNSALENKIKKLAGSSVKELVDKMASRNANYDDYDEVKNAILDSLDEEDKAEASGVFDDYFNNYIRLMILSGKRPDGRKPDEIRELSSVISVLPRTHGSAIFNRGQTQALSITTLGAPSLEQFIETAEGEETKRYIHHYLMPPYSVGETGRVGFPSRREIGHGALAERALLPVIPSEDTFPYTIRVVTEILSSNGSTSMASACGSTLSLMDAGVPIKAPIAGIAMGLIIDDTSASKSPKFKVLTDIVGIEDGGGDMDFKVAGSEEGITALQLDVKTLKLSLPMLENALEQSKKARLQILKVMKDVINKPKDSVSQHAPKIKVIKVPVDKIGEVIGPGGRMIKSIIADTSALIEVEDDGTVNISGVTGEEVANAVGKVEAIIKDPQAGEIYEGEVKRIQPFGAFVEILPNKDGLVHISDMSKDFVKDPNEVVKIGDKTQVRVKEIDDWGRINLSMILDPAEDKAKKERKRNDRPRKFDRRNRRYQKREKHRSTGPHFPASRLLSNNKK